RTKKAQADYEYYVMLAQEAREVQIKAQDAYARSVDYDRSVILQSAQSVKERLRADANLASDIYSQMAQQRELARAKIQEEKPVYAVVQPATLPQQAMNSRAKRVLIWGFMGLFLSLAWYGFGADFFKKMRSDVKEKLEEE
ncbi:MAG: chain-length determining protein, partial [Bacteroidales bacterium]|nr:chain-length determining protein [Bacteroidales bacterium]